MTGYNYLIGFGERLTEPVRPAPGSDSAVEIPVLDE